LLCYYRLAYSDNTLTTRLVGLQSDSLKLLNNWNETCYGKDLVHKTYQDLNKRLKYFIDIDRELQTRRHLASKKNAYGERAALEYSYYMHNDYHNFMQRFFDVKE
jgi:hypothetical protein